jgi:hypothetical protein
MVNNKVTQKDIQEAVAIVNSIQESFDTLLPIDKFKESVICHAQAIANCKPKK